MNRRAIFTVLLALTTVFILHAQETDLKETFLEAESYFLFEEYSEALNLYLKINRADPENNNIQYKIGVCFLNDPYQKDKSIRYLEAASTNVNPKYKINNFKERSAPLEAFFYLGNAYLVNNNIDKALENYQHFREILDEKIYDVELVEEQVRICERARDLMTKPVDFERKNLGEVINGRFSDINPIVSGDGNRLVFVSKRQFYDATFFSEKVDGEWQAPRNIIPELGVDGDVYPTSLSWDGNTMIIYRNDEFIGNLYVSNYVNGRWTSMRKLGPNINTKYWESHGTLSRDGKTLYFTSNRKDGFGGLDIYKSHMQSDGTWGPAINLGPTINTRYNEETPFLSENEQTLYFSSYGHYNMGGYDIFYSVKNTNGEWGTPINLGYPINTTDDDLFYFPINNGANAYFAQYLPDGYGRHDIYYLDVYNANNPRMYMIFGKVLTDKGTIGKEDNIEIYLIDRYSRDTIDISQPVIETQEFMLEAPKGDYDLVLHSTTFKDLIKNIRITDQTNKEGLTIDDLLTLETKPYEPRILTGEDSRIGVDDTLITALPGKKTKINLKVEKGSVLTSEHKLEQDLLSTETFQIDKKRFVYEFIPEEGTNILDFTMVEENGDISKRQVIVLAEKEEKQDTENRLKTDTSKDTDTENVQVESPTAEDLARQDSAYNEMQTFIGQLSEISDGKIKSVLDNLDARDAGITNADELFEYLKKQGVEDAEIEELKAILKTNNDADALLTNLLQQSEGSLHAFLRTINTDSLNIQTGRELMDYLKKAALENDFTVDDILSTVGDVNSRKPAVESTMAELKSYAKGDLKKYLDDLDMEKAKVYTPAELLDHLAEEAGEAFAPELLISVLNDMVSDRPLESFRDYLVTNGPDAMGELLSNLNLKKEGINTISDLIAYLLKHSDALGLTEEEMQMLMIDLLADFTIAPILDADPIASRKGVSTEILAAGGLLFAGILIIFIIFFFRRKKNTR